MKLGKSFTGIFLIAAAVLIGLALVLLPNWILTNYDRALSLGSFWGMLYLIVVGLGALLLIGLSLWTVWKLWGASLLKKRRRTRRNKNPSELSIGQRQSEIDENISQVEKLAAEAEDGSNLKGQLAPLLKEIEDKREAQTLEIVAFGTISSGKSSVLNLLAGRDVFATDARGGTTVTRNEIPWPGIDKVTLVDTPGIGEIDGAGHVNIAAESAKDADAVLVVVDGPLRESEHDLLERLGQMEKRVIICLNKSDWYSTSDREKLGDGKDLLMANLLLQSRGLVEKARGRVKDSLDRKAWAIVDKYMWGAGGVAALSPFPVVDLIAGSAISTKMIIDLAEVYQQKVDLDTASKWLSEMGKNLIGVLGAQGATVAVSAVVASLIKTIPFAGTIAGGVLQGAVQALITKWIGAVFIEYFRNEMQTPEGGLSGLARRKWEVVTSVDELRKLVQTAREKLSE